MQTSEIQKIVEELKKFNSERGWEKFHNPKNLAISISLEANELLEIFQWLTMDEATQALQTKKTELSEEIADVAIYLLLLAEKAEINLIEAIKDKIAKNRVKHNTNKEYDYLSSQ